MTTEELEMKNKVKILLVIVLLIIVGGIAFFILHPHNYSLVDDKEPTCTEEGYKNYKCWCGNQYTDTLEATGHDYKEELIEPTCTEPGKRVFTCSYCGDKYDESIEPTGHNYEVTEIDATCTQDGKQIYTCSNCGDTYEETKVAFGHEYVDGICAHCGEKDPSEKKTGNGTSGTGTSGSGNGSNGDGNKSSQSSSSPQTNDNAHTQGEETGEQQNHWGGESIDTSGVDWDDATGYNGGDLDWH
jgi:hypothetical protein